MKPAMVNSENRKQAVFVLAPASREASLPRP